MPLVTKQGFQPTPDVTYVSLEDIGAANEESLAVSVPSDTDAAVLVPYLENITLIGIDFPSFADGRGFSIAKRLRRLGFEGELRARGYLISDQYPHALACGFDTVEIDDEMAERQPYEQWKAATEKVLPPYRVKRAG